MSGLATSRCQIQDWLSGCGGVMQLVLRGVDVKCWNWVVFEAMCHETTMTYARLESVIAITHIRARVSWHFRSLKDEGLNIER